MLKTRNFDTFEEVRNSTIGSASVKKRQQLYREVFERLLVKGGLGVSQSVEGSIRVDAELPTYHYYSSKMFMPRFLCTKATLLALGIS